jgi:phosphonate metabolism protein PhnN/1,5-bisphosphokinase (PRPP-forming)
VAPDEPATARGTLFLVVGASGAGKDSVIAGARDKLDGDPRYVFARRYITRPEDAGGEDHMTIREAAYEAARSAGAFSLAWDAHGLRYALPASIEDVLATGRHVVANVSRSVIEEARRRYAPVRVVNVAAAPETIRRRLIARGRESAGQIAERVERSAAFEVAGRDVVTIDNDGALARAVDAMVALLLIPAP